MRTTTILTAGALGLVLAGAALAAPQGPRARLDPNASVTRTDMLAKVTQRFERIDANKDGMINVAEMAAHQAMMQERGRKWRAERAAARADAPASAASDAATAARREALAKFAKAREEAGRARGEVWFAMRDTDGDKLLSRDEFTAAAMKRFDRADADGDGVITPEERSKLREARRPRRG